MQVKTCKPAMGYSFAAGTTDGPGAFNFKQGQSPVDLSDHLANLRFLGSLQVLTNTYQLNLPSKAL